MKKIKYKKVDNFEDKRRGVLLPYPEFDYLIENIEDIEDYDFADKFKYNPSEATFSLDQVKSELFGRRS